MGSTITRTGTGAAARAGRRTSRWAAVLAAGALVMVGCGSDDTATPSSSETATVADTGATTAVESSTTESAAASDSAEPSPAESSPAESSPAESSVTEGTDSSETTASSTSSSESSSTPTPDPPPNTTKYNTPSPTPAPPQPFVPGKLPAKFGTWQVLTDADFRAGHRAKNGLDEVITGMGGSFDSKTPLPAQFGKWFTDYQAKLTPHINASMQVSRSFAIERLASYLDGTAEMLVMVTSVKVTGPDTAKLMSVKKADFQKEASKKGGSFADAGKVSCQVTADKTPHGCIVWAKDGWFETEILPSSAVTPERGAALVKAMKAISN